MLQSSLNNFGEEKRKINITITIGFCKILQKPNNIVIVVFIGVVVFVFVVVGIIIISYTIQEDQPCVT
jgi:hypothetical protein